MNNKESWFLVAPEATENMVLNPSAETTGNFAAEGAGTVTRVTTAQKYELYSYRVQTAANGEGINLTLTALANDTHYVSMSVAGTIPAAWRWSLNGTSWATPEKLLDINADWALYGALFSADQANGSTTLYVEQNGAGSGDFNLDGVQVEQKTYWTTYCDGNQPGCEWNGAKHASTSSRDALSRAGGKVEGLYDKYGFFVEKAVGTGTSALTIGIDSYALLPGGELNGIKEQSRTFQLIGKFFGDSEEELHRNRQDFINAISKDGVPQDNKGFQPVRVWFTGAEVIKEIAVHYQSGLEANLAAFYCEYEPGNDDWMKRFVYDEKVTIQFSAPDPYWYELGESAAEFNIFQTFDEDGFLHRDRDTGEWTDAGFTITGGSGTVPFGIVNAIVEGDDGKLYVAGNFTGQDSVANRNYIARLDRSSDTWETVVGVNYFNGIIHTMAKSSDGKIYIGGAFTAVNGDNQLGYLCRLTADGSAFEALDGRSGTPSGGAVYDMSFDSSGNLYFVGAFAAWDGIANTNRICEWDKTGFNSVITGAPSADAYAVGVTSDGDIWFGGAFITIAGTAYRYIAKVVSGVLTQVAVEDQFGFNEDVYAIYVDSIDDTVYIGGKFNDKYGVVWASDGTGDYKNIVSWDGQVVAEVAGGLWRDSAFGSGDGVFDINKAPNNDIYIVGHFTNSTFFTNADFIAVLRNNVYARSDLDQGGSDPIAVIEFTSPLWRNNKLFDIWVGDRIVSASTRGCEITTITNDGTAIVFPKIIITRDGDLAATTTVDLQTIRNVTTSDELLADYFIQDGEIITIDLKPTDKTIISSVKGEQLDALSSLSDFGSFSLQPGDNNISSFIKDNTAGAATWTAYFQWRTPYISWD